jgi:gamma-glutamyltranspeptidase
LGALNPASSGIGGGCYILYFDGNNKSGIFIDSREVAPSLSKPDMFVGKPLSSQNGGLAIAVLAELRGLHLAWKMFGKLSWKQVVEPVVGIAANVTVSKELEFLISMILPDLQTGLYPELEEMLMDSHGNPKKANDVILRPKFANTLKMVVLHFYGVFDKFLT